MRAPEDNFFFTASGTTANNTAIFGAYEKLKRQGNTIVTTAIEHPSIAEPIKRLEESGCRVIRLMPDKTGKINEDELLSSITADTILVSVMAVNNEVGSILPVGKIRSAVLNAGSPAIIHSDCIQAFSKILVSPKAMDVDIITVSGHKIHGPKGSGFLYIKDKTKIKPIIHGVGQQKGLRSGTENVPAIAGLAVAAEEMYANLEANREHLYGLRNYFITEVEKLDGVSVNGKKDHDSAPHIVSVSIEGVRAEVILHTLEDRNIYVSAGSACSSNKPALSRTLQSIGLGKELLDSTVRFSFGVHTTKEELDYALSVMREVIPMLQKYTRK
jgi:cysteine desulfurase